MHKGFIFSKLLFFISFTSLFANNFTIEKDSVLTNSKYQFKNSLGELKINFNDQGDQFLKFGFSSQFWMRSIENNPGTLVNGVAQKQTYDAGMRRMRLILNGQLSNFYSVYVQLGINNQSFIAGGGTGTGGSGQGKKPQIFFLDAYNELALVPRFDYETNQANTNFLYFGAGLHAWSGVSRLSNASTSRMLTLDIPVFNFYNIEVSDQFSRQFGVFVHGEYRKFNFRAHINKPFATNILPTVGSISDNNQSGNLAFGSYGMYQFLESENTSTSFLQGTYLGSKKVFNIGAGFYSAKNATLSQPYENVFNSHHQLVLGTDVFIDLPVGNKHQEMSMSLYSVLYDYNFGPNYIRTNGIMNPGTKDSDYSGQIAAEGFGNARFLLGTGKIWYTQAGFVLPKFSNKYKLQPFTAYAYKNLDALQQPGHYFDAGANLFILSQNAKIAYQYSLRPIYDSVTKEVFDRKAEHILSLQIAL